MLRLWLDGPVGLPILAPRQSHDQKQIPISKAKFNIFFLEPISNSKMCDVWSAAPCSQLKRALCIVTGEFEIGSNSLFNG